MQKISDLMCDLGVHQLGKERFIFHQGKSKGPAVSRIAPAQGALPASVGDVPAFEAVFMSRFTGHTLSRSPVRTEGQQINIVMRCDQFELTQNEIPQGGVLRVGEPGCEQKDLHLSSLSI